MRKCDKCRRSLAFSLVEMLVVIAVIAVLLSLLQPSLTKLFHKTGITSCKFTLKNLGMAYHVYAEQYDYISNMIFTNEIDHLNIKDSKGKKVNNRSYLTGSMVRRKDLITGMGVFIEEGLVSLEELECPSSAIRSTAIQNYKKSYPFDSSSSGCRVGYEYRPPLNYKRSDGSKYEHPSYIYETVEHNLFTGRAIINCFTDKWGNGPDRLIHDLEGMGGVLMDGSAHYFPGTIYNHELSIKYNRPNDLHEPNYDKFNKATSEIASFSNKHKL